MTGQPSAVEVLAKHQPTGEATGVDGGWLRHCACTARIETLWDRDGDNWDGPFAQHQAAALAAAGLLASGPTLAGVRAEALREVAAARPLWGPRGEDDETPHQAWLRARAARIEVEGGGR